MGKIITIANQKGGVGKTTTALCLGAVLESKGFKVLYVDLDTQANTSKVLKADTERKGAAELLNDSDKTPVKELVQVTASNESVISASFGLIKISGLSLNAKSKLNEIKKEYDFIVIDTPPTLSQVTASAFICTDYLILVANTDTFSLEGIGYMQQIINAARENGNPKLKINGILLERYSQRANINKAIKGAIEQIATAYNSKTYSTVIRETTAIRESQAAKMRITDYAPKSNANIDYTAFTDEVLKDLEG